LIDEANPHLLWWVLGEVASPAVRDLIAITPDLSFLCSSHLLGSIPAPPHLMEDMSSYQRSLFERGEVSFCDSTHEYLARDALRAPVTPRSAEARLSLLDEGVSRGFIDQPADVTREVIQHGVLDVLTSDAGAELRRQYDILPGALAFLGTWNHVFTHSE
jgi:hypothetical protein